MCLHICECKHPYAKLYLWRSKDNFLELFVPSILLRQRFRSCFCLLSLRAGSCADLPVSIFHLAIMLGLQMNITASDFLRESRVLSQFLKFVQQFLPSEQSSPLYLQY